MFKKFLHVERFGNEEVEGIEHGNCFVFPKIDGTNASVWSVDNEIQAGSRTRQLSLEQDNAGFLKFVKGSEKLSNWFKDKPHLRLYGEFLVKHSLRTYEDSAWNRFYIFDVWDDIQERFLSYDEYQLLLEQYSLDYIPCMTVILNGTSDNFKRELEFNRFLIKEDEGIGEGIVIKNYSFINKYGRYAQAKIVANHFKEKHLKEMGPSVKEFKPSIEKEIVEKYITYPFVDKCYNKIKEEDGWSSKKIPYLLNLCYHDMVKEEIWDIVKKNKNPTIDFKLLHNLTVNEIKTLKEELF